MKKHALAISMLTLGLVAATAGLPARADMGDLTFNTIFERADRNKDTMVTKQEFLDAMAKADDMKMEKMKASKDTKMTKGNGMTMDGLKSLINDLHHGA